MSSSTSICAYVTGIFISFRIAQRIYYVLKGHVHSLKHRPRPELEHFLNDNNVKVTNHTILSSIDGVKLRYRRMGTGNKFVLLANGVGTDLYMWQPVLKFLLKYMPSFFQDYTFIVETYRGLFGADDDVQRGGVSRCQDVQVTISNCVQDVRDIQKHAGKLL